MVDELVSDDTDLDRGALVDRYRTIVVVLALIIAAGLAWYLGTSAKDSANQEATAKAQTFSLAQEVAAACASPEVTADMADLCQSANVITKDGPAGAAGPPGDKGAQGATGFPGKDGAPGLNGLPGAIGPAGPPGVNGLDGATGPAGPVGATGATGATGPKGADGPAGPVGATGDPGTPSTVPGPTGETGATGTTSPFTFTFDTSGKPGPYTCTITPPAEAAVCKPVG